VQAAGISANFYRFEEINQNFLKKLKNAKKLR